MVGRRPAPRPVWRTIKTTSAPHSVAVKLIVSNTAQCGRSPQTEHETETGTRETPQVRSRPVASRPESFIPALALLSSL